MFRWKIQCFSCQIVISIGKTFFSSKYSVPPRETLVIGQNAVFRSLSIVLEYNSDRRSLALVKMDCLQGQRGVSRIQAGKLVLFVVYSQAGQVAGSTQVSGVKATGVS